jgi:hypothetical protein
MSHPELTTRQFVFILCNNKLSSDTVAHLPQESHSYWISSICCLKEVMQSSLMILLYTTTTLIVELAKTNLHTRTIEMH